MPDYPPPDFVLDALVETTKNPMLHQYTRGQVYTLYIDITLVIVCTFVTCFEKRNYIVHVHIQCIWKSSSSTVVTSNLLFVHVCNSCMP